MTSVGAIPVTTPARTLLDIAALSPPGVVEEAFDEALRRRLVSLSRLRWRLRETGRRGRGGVVLLRTLVDSRAQSGRPQSVFETRVLRLLKEAGLPRPVIQHEVRDRGAFLCIVDFAFPERRVAIEADGYRWHSGRLRFEHDLARRNSLTALGWRVIHVTWTDLTEGRETLVASVVRAMEISPPT